MRRPRGAVAPAFSPAAEPAAPRPRRMHGAHARSRPRVVLRVRPRALAEAHRPHRARRRARARTPWRRPSGDGDVHLALGRALARRGRSGDARRLARDLQRSRRLRGRQGRKRASQHGGWLEESRTAVDTNLRGGGNMDRRKFLARGGVAAAGSLAVAQAVAQTPSLPSIRWRCASSFPKSLDTIYGGGEVIAKRVGELTGGKFQIRVFAAGEIVPAFGVVDAIQQGTIQCAHPASYYFVGKNKTFAFDTTLPFGMNQREQNAWIYYGG